MQIKLRKKKLKDGSESLFLDIHRNGKRSYEYLKLYIKRGIESNKETMLLANKILAKRIVELDNAEFDQTSLQKKRASFIKYFEKFANTKEKHSNYYNALKQLKKYETNDIQFRQINKEWLQGFSDFLSKQKLKPNTVAMYYKKFRSVLLNAGNEGFISPALIRSVDNPKNEDAQRGFLELYEIEKLVSTATNKPEIKRAFLFSCFTGLRKSDILNLAWRDISNETIRIRQKKTKDLVSIPLSRTALKLLDTGNIVHLPDNKIFNLPEDSTIINRSLTRLFKSAGIDKKAYYHLSRHTYATLNLTSGNDLYTVSKLLGHKSVKTTELYSKIIDEKKKQAMDNLPEIEVM